MGSKEKAPPPPNLTPIVDAYKEAQTLSYKLGQDQLAWAKEAYNNTAGTTTKVVDALLDSQSEANRRSNELFERWRTIYQPAQERYLADAEAYNTGQRRDQNVAAAQAAVARNFEAARDSATRQLEGFGINPSDTRYAALDLGTRLGQAAASAGAGTQAARDTEAMGLALRNQAINMGNGLPGQSAAFMGTGNSAVQGAGGAANQLLGTGTGAMVSAIPYYGQGLQAVNGWGSTVNQGYQNQIDAYKADQASSSGVGALLGGAAGLVAGAQFGQPLTGAAVGSNLGKTLGFAEGGGVPDQQAHPMPWSGTPFMNRPPMPQLPVENFAPAAGTGAAAFAPRPQLPQLPPQSMAPSRAAIGMNAMPPQSMGHPPFQAPPGAAISMDQVWQHPASAQARQRLQEAPPPFRFAGGGGVPDMSGGAIPTGASPSGGAQVDDVSARLNAGEFILPKDVVSWIGEKQLQTTIQKARTEKQGAGAKPAIVNELPRPAAIQTREIPETASPYGNIDTNGLMHTGQVAFPSGAGELFVQGGYEPIPGGPANWQAGLGFRKKF